MNKLTATNMKEISKISKSFTCECGAVNKFEFETDFDVHDIKMIVRCQSCGRERTIELMNFFRRHPTILQPVVQPVMNYSNYSNPTPEIAPLNQENAFLAGITSKNQQVGNEDFFQAFSEASSAQQQQNPMNMFDSPDQNVIANESQQNSNSVNNTDIGIKNEYVIQRPVESVYAGLLDMSEFQKDEVMEHEIAEEIYEPFNEKEPEKNISIENNLNNNIDYVNQGNENIASPLNPASIGIQRKNDKDNEEEIFDSLFGNL